MVERHGFLQLLVDEAPLPHYDEVLHAAVATAASPAEVADLHAEHTLALQLRDTLEKRRSRQEQQRALVECAKELAEDRSDPDAILSLIVSQAQRLLGCDMSYLSLNDNAGRGDLHAGDGRRDLLGLEGRPDPVRRRGRRPGRRHGHAVLDA